MRQLVGCGALSAAVSLLAGCYSLSRSEGGGEINLGKRGRVVRASDVALTAGHTIEVVSSGFTFPTAVTFDDAGNVYVLESGYVYGEVFGTARLLRLRGAAAPEVIASSDNGPWTGVAFHAGAFYVAEGGVRHGGRILRIDPQGKITALVEGLPSFGDHHTNGPAVGRDGYVYFGQGSATNSAVVGEDNADFGWLARHPEFHDVPCRDVKLTGANFESADRRKPGTDERVKTGAYSAFGTPTTAGQVVPGKLPCTGAVMRVPIAGGPVELVAWGFRNPFGLSFAADGTLYVTDNGYDDRGSRPVFGSADMLWRVVPNTWYGWPDYSEGRPLYEDPVWGDHFRVPGSPTPPRLLAEHPNKPPKPAAFFGVHGSADGFDFSTSAEFGYVGQAFVALFGDQSPAVGKTLEPVGFKVVRVDVSNGVIADFAVNRAEQLGPASKIGSGGLERPLDARFDPSGRSLYVVDFGVLKMDDKKSRPEAGTGVLWRISRAGVLR
jgi:glucose/arabinose dehydrogenase